MRTFLLSFIPIFAAMNSLGIVSIFISLTENLSRKEKRKIINDSLLTAFLVGLIFMVVGKAVFSVLGITTYDFMIAGGIILLIIAVDELLKRYKDRHSDDHDLNLGVVPLGTPLITGPAVLTTLLMLQDTQGLVATIVSFVANIVICGYVLIESENINKLFGKKGTMAMGKVAHLLLGAIAVMMIRKGIFGLIGK